MLNQIPLQTPRSRSREHRVARVFFGDLDVEVRNQKWNMQVQRSFPLLSVLFVVFLVLRLTGVIDWSWWWVTAPLWGGAIAGFVLIIIFVAAYARWG